MLIDLTYRCSMNCSHCLSSCTPDGQDMTIDTLRYAIYWMKKHRFNLWMFTGGEIFEHEHILDMLEVIFSERDKNCPVTFITNGRQLVRNRSYYNYMQHQIKKWGKSDIVIQVTDDDRFYPDPLTEKEKYWLNKLGCIIETVPYSQGDRNRCLYPQGRALENFDESWWNTKAPKCVNCRLLAEQVYLFEDMIHQLRLHQFYCTPVIAPDGSIKVGESALCPPVATIYDDDDTILNRIRNFRCSGCKIPIQILKENSPIVYEMLFSLRVM